MKLTKAEILKQGPCSEGLDFLKKHKTLQQAWKQCPNPDWMIWSLSKCGLWDETLARRFAILCAQHTLHFFEDKYPDDKRPRLALQAAQDFLDGKIESAARSAAESAARSAARSAAWSAAWSAARSAAWSAARSAARSAAEKESQWQAETLRGLVNPFKK